MSDKPFEQPWGNFVLDKIVETQPPSPISWMPETLGWKIVFAFFLFLALQKIVKGYKNYQRNAYRRESLKWLKRFNQSSEQSSLSESHIRQLPILIRQTALNAFKREQVTLLTGKNWEQWLDAQCDKTSFASKCPNLLHQLAYAPQVTINPVELNLLSEQITLWVKYHRRQDD